MKRLIFGALFTIVWAIGFAPQLGAQTLAEGTWGGAITQLDGAVENVTFEVAYPEGVLAITLNEDGETVPLDDAQVEDGNLLFSCRSAEIVISCSLAPLADGSYEGDCTLPGDAVMVQMTMTPPGS